ncbi:MAG: HEPN domain-containing protein [Deltaproteobacteria bacterium]|nr:HEPN domain-containing protein [Deltaproteobacteria bacterium]
MTEIKNLLARSDRYVKSAKILIEDEDYESAVSRAYYAMFYVVEALLLTKEMSFSSHKAVISAFGEQFVKTGILKKDFSKVLTRAFEKRQIGDYEFTFTVTEKEAVELLIEAENFIAAIADYLIKQGYTL